METQGKHGNMRKPWKPKETKETQGNHENMRKPWKPWEHKETLKQMETECSRGKDHKLSLASNLSLWQPCRAPVTLFILFIKRQNPDKEGLVNLTGGAMGIACDSSLKPSKKD